MIGKARSKIRDLEQVSRARLEVREMEVWIWALSEESADLAQNLVLKCIEHGEAANRIVAKQSDVANLVESDLRMAAYYTYCD